ncbi:MAG: pyrimidine 5'-nucleotidase [Anaerolinea sp.]|nr:pyrimidine 5'-nucleotidase [Anaerolinea sp.]
MCFETIFFDLDDTLYLPTSGIWEAIGDRMVQYMVSKLDIPQISAPNERERLFHTHGTTMRGLVAEYHINEADFLEFVHDIPIDQYLSKDVFLRSMLEQYKQRKVIFTNADTGHANRVLNALGIQDLFEQIIDIRSMRPWCKPQVEAFAKAIELTGVSDPTNCVMIDDALRNLVTAHDFGLYTIHVGAQELTEPVDAAVLSLDDLPLVLPFN